MSRKYYSPPQKAKELGVSPEKIIGFIKSGELTAINVSNGLRATWRIAEDDWQNFLKSRSSTPPKRTRARRNAAKDYFAEAEQ